MPKLTIEERWRWWRETLGSPKYVCAPMVLQSELAFRMQVRRHGVGLCYAPMLPVAAFLESPAEGEDCEHPLTGGPCTQAAWFTTAPEDRPGLLAQLGGSDPEQCLAAALLVQDHCDGVDVNMGCPQRCAETGGYGAFLMQKPERARAIIETLVAGLRVPVTAKIRILPEQADTIAFAKMLEDAGIAALAVHGRLREARQHEGPADWSVIAAVKAALRIPVISNGNVRKKADADRCIAETGVDAVMSANGLLHNPRLFGGGGGGSGGGGSGGGGSGGSGSGGSGNGGCLVRDGRPTALGRRSMALEYLECCKQWPQGALPRMMSDHLLAILSVDLPAKEEAWRQRIKKRCKAYKTTTRTPEQFEQHVVRALEAGEAKAEAEAAGEEQAGEEQPVGVGSKPVGRGTPAGGVAAVAAALSGVPPPLDAEAIGRAAKRSAARRRKAGAMRSRGACDWWGWRLGVCAAALSASAWIILGPSAM